MIYTSDELIAATKTYASMGRKRGDTEAYLKAILRWEPAVVTAVLDEIERQLNVAQPQAVAVAAAEPEEVAEVPEEVKAVTTPAPPEPVEEGTTGNDEITDDEIKEVALRFISLTDSAEKAAALLLAEFDGVTPDEAYKFAVAALEDSRYTEKEYAAKMQAEASKARDKEIQAKAEADRLFLENYGYKHRKRIKVSPEDEAEAAKHFRALAEKASGPKTRLRTMSQSRKKKLYWLWENRIPFGTMSTVAGDPDEGKSLITLYLAARVSKGERLYGNTEDTEPGEVLLLSAEDDPEVTLRPRLEACGADLEKIHLLESVMLTDGAGGEGERIAQLDTDIKAIERILDENPAITLIIIDPISSFLGSANINREQEVRRVLQPLARRARTSGLAVVMVAHFNKNSETRSAMDRVGGAKAIVGMGRAAWTCIREPKKEQQPGESMKIEDPDRRLFLKLKGNLAPSKIGGLVYTIKTAQIEVEDKRGKPVMEEQPYIMWLEETTSTAQEVVIDRDGSGGKPKIDVVKEWLRTYLEAVGGYAPADAVAAAAAERSYSTSTLHRAKQQLKLKLGWIGRESHWALPNAELPAPAPMK